MRIGEFLTSIGPEKFFDPTDEHRALRKMVRQLSASELEPYAARDDESEQFNEKLFRRFGSEFNLFGLTVPADLGGAGLDPVASVLVTEELSVVDAGFALSYMAHEVLFVHNYFQGASPEQIERVLPRVLDGSWISGIAMTEPEAGTDVLGMRTTARRTASGYILNGVKQFITNAGPGDIFIVYAKTGSDDKSISAFLVETDRKGVSIGKPEKKLGMRTSPTAQLVFDEVVVPSENIVGAEGRGLVHMMRNLEIERVVLAAQSLGIARRCLEVGATYAITQRKQFGQPLSHFGQIQKILAEGFADFQAARALVYAVAHQIDFNERRSAGAAAAKLMAAQMAERVGRDIIQVLGGYGYTREYPVERLYRDAILISIGGGTNEAMEKNLVKDMALCFKDQ